MEETQVSVESKKSSGPSVEDQLAELRTIVAQQGSMIAQGIAALKKSGVAVKAPKPTKRRGKRIDEELEAAVDEEDEDEEVDDEEDEDEPRHKGKKGKAARLFDTADMHVLMRRLKTIKDPTDRAKAIKRAIKQAKDAADDLDVEIDDIHPMSNADLLWIGAAATATAAAAWYFGDKHGQSKVRREYEHRVELSDDEMAMVRTRRLEQDKAEDQDLALLAERYAAE